MTSMSTQTGNKTKVLICPYCGDTQAASERCRTCGGLFEPLSRQASHNAMGPWHVRDERRPFQPGASYETIVKLVERGQIDRYSIIRGPTTRQFWTIARRVPGIAHLLGYCHNCDASVGKDDHGCPVCGVPFGAYLDRNYLGLPEIKPLPWEPPSIDNGRPGGAPHFTPMPPMPASSGPAGFSGTRPMAQPLGLSSFASDAELRGISASSHAPPAGEEPEHDADDHAGGAPPALAHEQSAAHPWPRSTILEGSPSDVATRSMQRRLERQQGTIRLLMALVGVVAIGSIAVIAVLIARVGRLQTEHASTDRPAATQSSPPALQQVPATAGDAGDAEGLGEVVPTEPDDEFGLSEDSPAATGNQAATAPQSSAAMPSGPITEDHQRATSLIADAKKEDRALKDRIRDCEEALGLLRGIKARAADNERPAGLDQQIADADRLLERLKLKAFFP